MISRDSGRLKPKSVGGRYATGYPIDSGQRQGVAAGDLDAAVEMLEARVLMVASWVKLGTSLEMG